MDNIHLRESLFAGLRSTLLILGIPVVLGAIFFGVKAQGTGSSTSDMLAYVSDAGHLMLYDPITRTETLLLEDVHGFVLSRDGQVAFTRQNGDNLDLYVFDPSTPEVAPISIHQTPGNEYAQTWSSDGRSLAFVSYEDREDKSLFVWNRETIINVMPNNPLDTVDTIIADWSQDGRLAFWVRHGWSDEDIPSEIYIWDGTITTSLSQSPGQPDGTASWNGKSQLLFRSVQDDETITYVWDGISFKDSLPDRDTFIHVAPQLEHSNVSWVNDDTIGFTVYSDTILGEKEVVLWDLLERSIVERFSVSSENAYSWLAEGGQMVLSSHLASGIPSVYLDVENIEGDIIFSEHVGEYAWSPDGYLAYCGITEEGQSRLLSLWNGTESWLVAEVSYRPVQWQNGRRTFSCNNG